MDSLRLLTKLTRYVIMILIPFSPILNRLATVVWSFHRSELWKHWYSTFLGAGL
jgi:hypothetical protein